jgi:pimeloyl-ACP methyl ester carboxylesterase
MNEIFNEMLEISFASQIFRPPQKDVGCFAPIQRKYNKMIRTIDTHEIHVRLVTPSGSKCTFENYDKSKQILVYAHGNATDVDAEQSFSEWLCEIRNCNLIVFDYPGYGKSSGEKPSINSMNSAAMAVIMFVQDHACLQNYA